MHTTSASLLMRLRQPEQAEAWSRFVRMYSPMLYSWACQMGLQDADAQDLVQDVFATLLRKLPSFNYDDQKSFRSWLRTVALNKWRDRGDRATLPFQRDADLEVIPHGDDSSTDAVEFHHHLVGTVLPTLEPHFQHATWQAFWRHVIEGRPAKEVARELNIAVNMVYVAKFRVLARLHKELE